jgi:hypothetical protein
VGEDRSAKAEGGKMRALMVVVCCVLTLVACNGTLPALPTTIEGR